MEENDFKFQRAIEKIQKNLKELQLLIYRMDAIDNVSGSSQVEKRLEDLERQVSRNDYLLTDFIFQYEEELRGGQLWPDGRWMEILSGFCMVRKSATDEQWRELKRCYGNFSAVYDRKQHEELDRLLHDAGY